MCPSVARIFRADRPQADLQPDALEDICLKAHRIIGDVAHDAGLHDHEATVDPALAHLRLLSEFDRSVFTQIESTKSGRGPDRGQGRQLAEGLVLLQETRLDHRADSIPIGKHEAL